MNSRTTSEFRKLYAALPADVRSAARRAFELWSFSPEHSSLRFKKVHATEPIFSARINLKYRAMGLKEGDTVIWFWIGAHGKYDKLLR